MLDFEFWPHFSRFKSVCNAVNANAVRANAFAPFTEALWGLGPSEVASGSVVYVRFPVSRHTAPTSVINYCSLLGKYGLNINTSLTYLINIYDIYLSM